MILVHFQGKSFNITVIQVYAPTSNAEEAEVEPFHEDLQDLLELTSKKGVLFIIKGWNAKDGGQKIPGVTGKMVLEYKILNREKANRILPRKCTGHKQTPSSNNTRDDSTHGHHQMVNTEIRLIIFFAAKDGEAIYSHQKQDWELTVAQIRNSLLQNSDLN